MLPPKPFRSYPDLVALLTQRGMVVADQSRAERKLAQLGYYRLSGYWYPARDFVRDAQQVVALCPITQKPLRQDRFVAGTDFDTAVALYQFDKKLRLLMLDGIERLEVHLKTVVAHEVGFHDAMAYTNVQFIQPKWTKPHTNSSGITKVKWADWNQKQLQHIQRSKEDSIQWHFRAKKQIPIWVAVEAWDFGDLSQFFELLAQRYQNLVLARLGLGNAKEFSRWLQQISYLRNRCAHHTRIWNQVSANPLSVPTTQPFFQAAQLDPNALRRLHGLIAIMWFLLQRIAPNSTWLREVADLVDTKPALPGCTFSAMGFPTEAGFPRTIYGL